MKKIFLLLLLVPFFSYSQNQVNVDKVEFSTKDFYVVGGVPVVTAQYYRVVEGTPYFVDQWMDATMKAANGQIYKVENVKLDLVTNDITFIDKDGIEKTSMSDIRSIEFNLPEDRVVYFKKLPVSPTAKKESWLLELYEGKDVVLFTEIIKTVVESTPYGTSTVEKRIRDSNKFYIYVNNVITPVKSLTDLPDLLPKKKKEMQSFISGLEKKKNAVNSFTKAIEYYNSII